MLCLGTFYCWSFFRFYLLLLVCLILHLLYILLRQLYALSKSNETSCDPLNNFFVQSNIYLRICTKSQLCIIREIIIQFTHHSVRYLKFCKISSSIVNFLLRHLKEVLQNTHFTAFKSAL